MARRSFDNLMLIGRAGSGKSELVDFLKTVSETERFEKYNIGAFDEIDDFPWIHAMFKDEDIWEKLGCPRRLSKRVERTYETLDYDIYDFTTLKFNIEIERNYSGNDGYYDNRTLFIEYARGREDGYRRSFDLLDEDILERTAIFYMDNTFEESMRRNTTRSSDKDEKQTILYHKVPLGVMENYYRTHDWYDLTDKEPHGHIVVKGMRIPFVTVWNVPESHDMKVLEERYSPPLKKLWDLYENRFC